MSWDEAFSRRYGEWSAHMTADIAFYVELARTAQGSPVELAVGNGRVAVPVAQATGQRVIGIDCPFRALLHLPTWAGRRRTPLSASPRR
jgi:hypothetical protein